LTRIPGSSDAGFTSEELSNIDGVYPRERRARAGRRA